MTRAHLMLEGLALLDFDRPLAGSNVHGKEESTQSAKKSAHGLSLT